MIDKYFNNLGQDIINKAKKIKLIISDVDGVLTDGSIYIDKEGNDGLVRFNILDGMGIVTAMQCGINFAVISGRSSSNVAKRLEKINVEHVFLGVKNKVCILNELIQKLNIHYDEISYIGDDINDLKVMNLVGLKVSPPGASNYVLKNVDYVTSKNGGSGAVRELIDLILECKNISFELLENIN